MSKIEKLARKVDAAIEAYKSQRLRWIFAISQVGINVDEAHYRKVTRNVVCDEIERQMVIGALREHGELTVSEMNQITGMAPSQIICHVLALRKNGAITEIGEKKNEYLYKLTL